MAEHICCEALAGLLNNSAGIHCRVDLSLKIWIFPHQTNFGRPPSFSPLPFLLQSQHSLGSAPSEPSPGVSCWQSCELCSGARRVAQMWQFEGWGVQGVRECWLWLILPSVMVLTKPLWPELKAQILLSCSLHEFLILTWCPCLLL